MDLMRMVLPMPAIDRKSTRLNSSHVEMSYAVFYLKKKNNDARAQKLEGDLAELEAEGAKVDVWRRMRVGGERERRQSCDRAQCFMFFFDEAAATLIYTLSLHDALPI